MVVEDLGAAVCRGGEKTKNLQKTSSNSSFLKVLFKKNGKQTFPMKLFTVSIAKQFCTERYARTSAALTSYDALMKADSCAAKRNKPTLTFSARGCIQEERWLDSS